MSRKGYVVIRNLIQGGYASMIDKVVAARDRNMVNDYYDEITSACKAAGIAVYDKYDDYEIESKYCITVSWRWMIHLTGQTKLIVFHDSLLPKYRGFCPLVNMLINREPYVGVTALYASEEYDKGDIITSSKVPVSYPIRITDAIDFITPLFADIVREILDKIKNGVAIESAPQNEKESSYSLWRDEEDYRIDWSRDSEYLLQFVYSVGYPFKGAFTTVDGNKVRVLDCELYDDVRIENRMPGKVIFMENGFPVVVCGSGLLKLTDVRDENGATILPLKRFRTRFV